MSPRRTNLTVSALATVAALWLGLTAPSLSPVAPPPPAGAAPATAGTPTPVPTSVVLVPDQPPAAQGHRR